MAYYVISSCFSTNLMLVCSLANAQMSACCNMTIKSCVFVTIETTDTDITTTEIIKRRDVGPYGIRSEYCIRKIICPLGNRDTPKGKS